MDYSQPTRPQRASPLPRTASVLQSTALQSGYIQPSEGMDIAPENSLRDYETQLRHMTRLLKALCHWSWGRKLEKSSYLRKSSFFHHG